MNNSIDAFIRAEGIMDQPAFAAFWRQCESMDFLKASAEWDKIREEALEIDSMVDEAVFQATVFCDNANLDHVVRQHSVDSIRNQLLSLNRYPARFIVKMMISVRRLAGEARVKAKANYQAMMSRPFVTDIDHEIPF